MQYSVCQMKAIDEFKLFITDPNEKEFILSGFSGVGKTTVSKVLIDIINKQNKFMQEVLNEQPYTIALTATTNKAVRALKDAVIDMEVDYEIKTIYSYLGLRLQRDYNTGKEKIVKSGNYKVLSNNIVLVDEAGYSDFVLLKIIKESFINSKVIYIGDKDQLLSVNAETSVALEREDIKHKVHMVTPQRNIGKINELGHEYRNVLYGGNWPIIKPCSEITIVNGPDFKKLVEDMYTSKEYDHNPNHCKILAWSNTRVNAYNAHIRMLYTNTEPYVPGEYLTSNTAITSTDGLQIMCFSDTTMKIESASEIQEDSYGIPIQHIRFYRDTGNSYVVPLDFKKVTQLLNTLYRNKDFSEYFRLKSHYADFRPSHACTVHKAQGSTFKNVFLDIGNIGKNNKPREVARLLYVATTRASHHLYIYGELPNKYIGE